MIKIGDKLLFKLDNMVVEVTERRDYRTNIYPEEKKLSYRADELTLSEPIEAYNLLVINDASGKRKEGEIIVSIPLAELLREDLFEEVQK